MNERGHYGNGSSTYVGQASAPSKGTSWTGPLALGILLGVGGIYLYGRHAQQKRQEAVRELRREARAAGLPKITLTELGRVRAVGHY